MQTPEEWRATHHPCYEVSNLGRVRSWKSGAPRILKGSKNISGGGHGYPTVIFYPEVEGNSVHSLVAAAFIGPCPAGHYVMHKDDNRANARLDNLEYGTPYQNTRQCISRNRWTRRKFTEDVVREIRQRAQNTPRTGPAQRLPNHFARNLAKEYGVSERCIEAIIWGRNYTRV